MQILMTGGTGLIGRQLCKVLLQAGHTLTVLSRKPETVAAKCGATVSAFASLAQWTADRHFDAVINLAGEPIVDARWSTQRKQQLRDSRVALTEALVQRMSAAQQKPSVFLSGSAIGYYGNGGDALLDELSPAGSDFAAQLCYDWELAANTAETLGVRICLLRTGLVLSAQGGLLGRMRLPFKWALGARLGDGRQWMSWVHIDDYVAMVLHLLHNENCRGAVNLTAPQAVTNNDFTQMLAEVLHRPAPWVAPAALLRLSMGERAALLLEGQRVVPHKLASTGFVFRYPALPAALRQLLNTP